MKKWPFVIFCSAALLVSCSGKKNSSVPGTDGNSTDSSTVAGGQDLSFFPVTSFLQGQLNSLDSLQVTVLQINSTNGKADSTWIPKEKIKPLLQPFVTDRIDKGNLVSLFNESKFNDQTTEAITFTYTPKNSLPDSISIRHWDVYVDPEKGTIKRVYIVKQSKQGDATLIQQLTWQTNKSAKIVSIGADGKIQSELKWIWDLND